MSIAASNSFIAAVIHPPEAEATPASLSLLFLAGTPSHPDLKGLETLRISGERFKLAEMVA